MNISFFILLLIVQIYKNELCEDFKTCYNCSISNSNCSWSNNICTSSSSALYLNNNNNEINSFLSQPYITSQYKCIQNKNEIEIYKEFINGTITLSLEPNISKKFLEKINYHIYCFQYTSITSILITIHYNEKYKNNIIHLSIYDNLTNTDKIINLNSNDKKFKITSLFFCIKITYFINNEVENIISFHITKHNDNNNDFRNKNENIISYIILGAMILLITVIIWVFILWHKNKSSIMKEIIIMNKGKIYQRQNNETNESRDSQSNNNNNDNNDNDNDNDKSNCSELQEKYFQLEQNSFVAHNYETLYSFVKNIHDIEKKDKYLKTIIKTMPSFIIGRNNIDLIGSLCSFCENKIKLNDNVCLLNCGHIFHYDCIYQQIITNEEYKCIICKENIII